MAWAPAPRGGPGGKPRCRALWAEGDPLSISSQAGWLCLRALLASKLFCEGRAWLFLGSGMRRAGDHDIALKIYRNNNYYSNASCFAKGRAWLRKASRW